MLGWRLGSYSPNRKCSHRSVCLSAPSTPEKSEDYFPRVTCVHQVLRNSQNCVKIRRAPCPIAWANPTMAGPLCRRSVQTMRDASHSGRPRPTPAPYSSVTSVKPLFAAFLNLLQTSLGTCFSLLRKPHYVSNKHFHTLLVLCNVIKTTVEVEVHPALMDGSQHIVQNAYKQIFKTLTWGNSQFVFLSVESNL